MVSTMSKSKIDAFINSILTNRETFDAEKRVKAKGVLRSIPLDKESAEKIIALGDVDFSPIAQDKVGERFEDVQAAMEDSVEQGVETFDDFASWLGLEGEEDANKVMDFAHAYIRLGQRKNPKSMSNFLG